MGKIVFEIAFDSIVCVDIGIRIINQSPQLQIPTLIKLSNDNEVKSTNNLGKPTFSSTNISISLSKQHFVTEMQNSFYYLVIKLKTTMHTFILKEVLPHQKQCRVYL